MTCRELAEILIDYVSGELDGATAELVRQHMDRCPPCVHYVETYELTIQITRKLPPAPMPPQLEQRLRAALQAPPGGAGA